VTTIHEQLLASLAGRYAIDRELGRGGMATVYLAEDVRHRRKVALKVLHPELSAVLGPERFLKEIELTASLQHPHILPLFDSGSADGQLFYVMPFVEGETLRDRLTRETQLPVDDALRIAREVADALQYAHERHVIHRDIKPENILLQGGHALVADFGIALAVQQAGGQRMTQTGLSLGTPQYMAPEQAMGEKAVDARADVYALGAVTYEMLAGEPPFTGPTAQAIIARVLTSEAQPLTAQRRAVSPQVAAAVHRALEKLPADRWASAAEFSRALVADGSAASAWSRQPNARSRGGWRTRLREPLVLTLAALVLALAAALGVVARRGSSEEAFPLRVDWVVTGGAEGAAGASISADGHAVVYVGQSPSGRGTSLYLRRLDQLVSRLIPGSDNAASPVFSPDGKSVAFVAGRRRIVRIPIEGGSAVPLADVPDDGGIDWSPTGEIVAGAGVFQGLNGLSRVNAAGRESRSLTRVDTTRKELSHQYPRVLSDGRTVLFMIWYGTVERSELAATSLDDGKVVPLGIIGTRPLGVVDGQLVYVRADGVAMAVPFDVGSRRVTGAAVPVLDSIRMFGAQVGNAGAFLTPSGNLVFATGTLDRRLTWVERGSVGREALSERREFNSVRLSPDGRQAALGIGTGSGSNLWILDIGGGTLSPLTTNGLTRNPNWSPDGRRILYASTQGGRAGFWWQPADGSGPAVKAGDPRHNPWNADLSADGKTAVFNAVYDGTFNLETFSFDSAHEERDMAASPTATETWGRFSPDGRSIAYNSDESGRVEVYIRPFPEAGSRVQVSAGGGTRAIWAPDGKTLYYRDGTKVMAATLARDPALRVVSRAFVFDGPYAQDFDVSRDGTRFLMIESGSSGLRVVAIPNWRTELRQLTGARTR
jgi:serine/threonine-protein kinase